MAKKRKKRQKEDLAATRVQSVARSRMARKRVDHLKEFNRTPSGRYVRLTKRVSLVKTARVFNDGVRRIVSASRVGKDTGCVIACATARVGGGGGHGTPQCVGGAMMLRGCAARVAAPLEVA